MRENDYITFKVSKSGGRVLCVRVIKVMRFDTFAALMHSCGVDQVLPQAARDILSGVRIYYEIANRSGVSYKELEARHGVVAIEVQPL